MLLETNVSPVVIGTIRKMLPQNTTYGQQPLREFAAIKVFVPAKLMTDEFLRGRPISSPFVLEKGAWSVAPEWRELMRSAQDAGTSKGALFVSEQKLENDVVVTIQEGALGVPAAFEVTLTQDSTRFTVPVTAVLAPALQSHWYTVIQSSNIVENVEKAVEALELASFNDDDRGVKESINQFIRSGINEYVADEVFTVCTSALLSYLLKIQTEADPAKFKEASKNMRQFLVDVDLLTENADGSYSFAPNYALYSSRRHKGTARPIRKRRERQRGAPYTTVRGSFADACV